MLCWLGEVAVGTRTPSRLLYCECMFTQLEPQHNMQRPFTSSADDRRNRELTACIIVQVSTRHRRRAAVASIRISRVLIGCASAVERRGKVVNTRASYSAGPEFQSRSGNRLSWLKSFALFAVSPGECWDGTVNDTTTSSFYILSNSSFTYRPFIWNYIVWVTEKASLNKLQTTTVMYVSCRYFAGIVNVRFLVAEVRTRNQCYSAFSRYQIEHVVCTVRVDWCQLQKVVLLSARA
jgi:hypothetical protein